MSAEVDVYYVLQDKTEPTKFYISGKQNNKGDFASLLKNSANFNFKFTDYSPTTIQDLLKTKGGNQLPQTKQKQKRKKTLKHKKTKQLKTIKIRKR
jgi:hypothetical protein